MQENGLPKSEILKMLENKLENDLSYSSGKILGSMCTEPNDFALEVFGKYAFKNLGDPGLFPKTLEIEQEVISEIGKLLHGNNIHGSILSGGSEANIVAIRIARKMRPDIKEPEIVCSENAHMSFFKAADFMGLKIHTVPLNADYLPDMDAFASAITKNTIALVGIAGTTALGLVEPIDKIARLAKQHEAFLHIDAAFGGFTLPFLEDLGYTFPPYDFRVPEVTSITSDPHKMGMGLIPGGGLLIRENTTFEKYGFSIPYLAGGNYKHLSITGTRPGGSVISFWALMQYLGREGFRNVVKECWDNTLYIAERIKDIQGIELVTKPQMNILGIRCSEKIAKSVCRLDNELRKHNWALGIFSKFNLARVVCMPHIKRHHVDEFLDELDKAVKKIRAEG